jgi:hypothetical protein
MGTARTYGTTATTYTTATNQARKNKEAMDRPPAKDTSKEDQAKLAAEKVVKAAERARDDSCSCCLLDHLVARGVPAFYRVTSAATPACTPPAATASRWAHRSLHSTKCCYR